MSHRGHKSSLALVLAPSFELGGGGAEHTFSALLHRAATPHHLTTNATPIMFLGLTVALPSGAEQTLRLEAADKQERAWLGHSAVLGVDRFCQYRVVFGESTEPFPAGTEIRFRVRDISGPDDRRWKLQWRWPFISRPYPVSHAALVVLIG